MVTTLKAVQGMLDRLNKTLVFDGFFNISDIRYRLEHTEGNLYSINQIDIDGNKEIVLKTLVMDKLENLYWVLYCMCNTLDNLTYTNGHYNNIKYDSKVKNQYLERFNK